MKRLFIALIIILCLQTSFAQEFQKNIIGIRGGMNIANMTSHGLKATHRKSMMFGVSDQIHLTKSLPLYLETGAYLSWKGYRIKGFNDSKTKLWYAQIPVMVNYHLHINESIYFEPNLGFYYAYDFHGRRKYAGDKIDVIDKKEIKKSDFGFTCGVGFTLQKFHLGMKYEIGFLNIAKSDLKTIYNQELGYDKLHNRCLSIYIGSNF